jgi:glycosyltransferase involved in cell wall biosynthesis
MRVCYFGPYDSGYPRNRVIIKGLRKNGVDVIECNSQSSNRLLDYAKLLKKHNASKYDAIILGARGDYFGQPLVPIIRRITRKPVIFDAVLTLYETIVSDRKLIDEEAIRSRLLYLLDYEAFHMANLVLSDTNAHTDYYSHFYELEVGGIRRILVGSDDEVFYPRESTKKGNSILVMFWGGFIPLQGVKYIIEAAKSLENHKDLRFEMRGFGQTYESACKLCRTLKISNLIIDPNWVSYNELPSHIARADICLGIFGETEKAKRVIPNKAIEALAMEKPLITGDSPAAREILRNMENCVLVPMANPKAIADAVLALKEDKGLREKIAENGYRLFKERLGPKAIGKQLKSTLMEFIREV